MRLWSLHPKHLDALGLVALWREGLLARAVLSGCTKGYRNHPQLNRFKHLKSPVVTMDRYLSRVFDEAQARGYRFEVSKINYLNNKGAKLQVTDGQLRYEWLHLLAKLEKRDPIKWKTERLNLPAPLGCFQVVTGPIADWELPARNVGETEKIE